jgi:hypothetical protein
MQAKYTFMEAATQHGYLVALMAPRMSKSRDFYRIVIDQGRGRVFQLYKTTRPDVPAFEFVIPERDSSESTLMWRDKCKKMLDKAWKGHQKALEERREARFGAAISAPSPSELSSPSASSTDAPPRPESSPSESEEGESGPRVSDPEPSTPGSSTIDGRSSMGYVAPSRKSGSRPRSSSGASTASSG